jgi:hypothetical protein
VTDPDPVLHTVERRRHVAGFVRDVIVFQGKLLLDGARDALLIPASLFAAALDLIRGRIDESGAFDRVLALGRRSERYINLFGRRGGPLGSVAPERWPEDVDELVAALESQLVDPQKRAQLSTTARARLVAIIEALRRSGPESRRKSDG